MPEVEIVARSKSEIALAELDRVRAAGKRLIAGAEAGKASDTVEALTDDFDGNAGQLDKRSLGNLVRVYALRGQSIRVLMGPTTIEPRGDRIVAVATGEKVRRGLEPDEAVVAADDPVVGVVLPRLGKCDEVVVIDLNLRLSYPYVSQRGGSGHGVTPPGL